MALHGAARDLTGAATSGVAPARSATLGVDVSGSLNLIGWSFERLGLVFLFPAALAIGYREAVWPFLVAGLARRALGSRLSGHGRKGARRDRARAFSSFRCCGC